MAQSRRRSSRTIAARTTPVKRAASPASPLGYPKRTRASNATPASETKTSPKKSGYFASEPATESEPDIEDSGYEDEDASATEPDETSEDEYGSDSDPKVRKRGPVKGKKSSAAPTSTAKAAATGGELWREGVRSHLEPGQELRIQLPKARPAGKIPYADSRIHPNTMLFLSDLKAHNDRGWLKTHDADFRQAEQDWKSFVGALGQALIEVDETIPELPVNDVVYRIYRDIRFSPDQTPYKSYFSAAWSRTGRKGPYAAYYLQVAPKGGSIVGGGLWMPDSAQLVALRGAIDRKVHKLKAVLMEEGIRKEFLDGVGKDEKKVVKAFAAQNKNSALKTKPKGYSADHPEIELLKLRNFTIVTKIKDEEVTGKDSLKRISGLMATLAPFITYLNSVVLPDDSSSDEDDDDEGDDDEGDDDEDIAADQDEDGVVTEPGDLDDQNPEDFEPE